MAPYIYPLTKPFHLVTGELLPDYRDAYVLGQLKPTIALQVERYLSKSSIQTSLVLARYHELSDAAKLKGRTVSAPRWVQQQLLFQPLMSAMGPLRRPVVRVAAGLFLALSVASGVQWARNKPLVPAPIVVAMTRAAASVSHATHALVTTFAAPEMTATSRPADRRFSAVPKTAKAKPHFRAMAEASESTSTAAPATEPADSLARGAAASQGDSTAAPAVAALAKAPAAPRSAPASGTVRGYVRDSQGRPLVGATVLVKSTLHGASTDASGQYVLEVPAGTTLQFGYAGYADLLRSATLGTMNVVLEPSTAELGRHVK